MGKDRSVWQEIAQLSRLFPARVRFAGLVIGIGIAAAIGEVLSVGLAVILLFTLLREGERIQSGGGLLGEVSGWVLDTLGNQTALIAGVFFGFLLLTALIAYANNAVAGIMLNRVAQRLRDEVHDTYVHVGYADIQGRDHGTLVQILTNETWTVADAFYSASRICVGLCAVVIFGTGLFVLSVSIGLTALFGAIVAFFLLRLVARPTQRLGRRTLEANHRLSDRMLMSLSGMRTLRVFALETHMEREFEDASREVQQRGTRTELVKAATAPLNQLFGLGVLLAIVLVASVARIDVATTIAGVLMLFRLQPYLQQIETERVALAGMSASLRQVREMIDRDDKIWPSPGHRPLPGPVGALRFEDVSFIHDARKGPSVSGLNFTILAGRVTALHGPSGSGKTTILNLILRLYEPDTGRITVDGVDLSEITRASWLSRLAIAGQDIELIEETVLQNLRLGRPEASLEQVREVCRLVEILDDLEALPDGLDTVVGAAGLSFSGGQRQRLGLARALLKDPEILLLDEAMSALEADREHRIWTRLRDRMKGRTIVMISHRANSTNLADDVIWIRQGHAVTTQEAASL